MEPVQWYGTVSNPSVRSFEWVGGGCGRRNKEKKREKRDGRRVNKEITNFEVASRLVRAKVEAVVSGPPV